MTAILVYKNGRQIMVGADGASIIDDEFKEHHSPYDEVSAKLHIVKGSPSCFIVLTGAVKGIDAIRGYDGLLDNKKDVTYNYVINTFIPRLFEIEKNYNVLTYNKDGKALLDCSGILVTPTKIFSFYGSGYVMQVEDIVVRGNGDSCLISAYLAYKDKLKGLKLVKKCFADTIKYHGQIGCPVRIYDNKGNKYIFHNEEELNK